MPTVAAATIHTDQLINGNAFDHIIRPVRHEKAIAFPAAPRILWGALFHPPTVYPLAGTTSIGKISRGKLAAGRHPSGGKRENAITVALLRYLSRKQDERREQGKDEKRIDYIQPLWHDVPPED